MNQFFHFLTLGYLLDGVGMTLEITGGAFLVGLIGGAILAALQLGKVPVLPVVLRVFALITRGTPVLLQLLFVYDVLPSVGINLSAVTTSVLVLGLNTTTFFSEIMRGSVLSLDRGQVSAAQSLGMDPLTIARYIISPQAIRVALPQMANQTVVLILTSSLASTISVSELTLRSETLSSSTFEVIPVYLASGVMYLVLTTAVAAVQLILERSLDLDRVPSTPEKRISFFRRVALSGSILRQGLEQVLGIRLRADPPLDTAGSPPVSADIPSVEEVSLPGDSTTDEDTAWTLEQLLATDLPPAASEHEPMLSVTGVKKRYRETWALTGIDLDVRAGEVVVIIGASGCGKSTLLRCIAQLESVDAGDVLVAGTRFGKNALDQPLKGKRLARARAEARVAMVFQNFELFKHMTALRNVTVALETVYGYNEERATEHALQLLDAIGLRAHADKLPRHLSGGQQQRVAIARSLAIAPRVMLLDEPTSALDPEMVHEVLNVLRALANAGMTMVIVTHEVKFAMEIADRLIFMADGRVVESGRADEVLVNAMKEGLLR